MKRDGYPPRKLLKFIYTLGLLLIIITFIMVIKEYQTFTNHNWLKMMQQHPRFRKRTNQLFNDHMIRLDNTTKKNTKFANILLVVSFGDISEYESIPLFELLYKTKFPNRLYCGPTSLSNVSDIDMITVNTGRGAFLYDCLTKTILAKKEMNYTGYLFVGEDVLLNYWRMDDFETNKIWQDRNIKQGPLLYEQSKEVWEWWQSPWGLRAMEKVHEYFIELNYYDNRKAKLMQGDWKPDWDAGQCLNTWLWNSNGNFATYWSNRSFIYIPHKYSQLYTQIAKHFRASGVRHNIALPTITRLIVLTEDITELSTTDVIDVNRDEFLNNRDKLNTASISTDLIFIDGNRKTRRNFLNHLRMKEYAVGKFLQYRRNT